MGRRDLRLAHFVAVTPARAAQLQRDPSAVTALREGKREETGRKDAVLVVSDAFVLEKAKKRVFATMLSTAKAAELDATLRERRALLERKHGAPVVMPPELASAAKAWEAWWAKQAG